MYSVLINGTAISVTDAGLPTSNCNEILIEKVNIRADSNPTNLLNAIEVTSCVHAVIRTLSVTDMYKGILLTPTTTSQNKTSLVRIEDATVITAQVALLMQPQSSTAQPLQDVHVGSSYFSMGSRAGYAGPGILIDPNGGGNGQIDTVRLVGVTSQRWPTYGLEVKGGQNIQVVGGKYSANHTAGIGLTGAAANTGVVGSDLTPSYPGSTITQPKAIDVTGTPTNLQAHTCPGYNDQGTLLSGFVGSGTVTIDSSTFGYWGPMEFYVSPGAGATITAITLDAHDTHLKTGSFLLAPGEVAVVTWTPPATLINLVVIGK